MNAIADTGGLSRRQAGPRNVPADGGTWPADGGTWTLAHRPEAVREARDITKEALDKWKVAAEAADLVLLVVSELVTNAVEHARPPVLLCLCRDPQSGRVHVEVTDAGPAPREGDWAASCTEDERGRGLTIIDCLTVAHGDRRETDRATHWADLTTAA